MLGHAGRRQDLLPAALDAGARDLLAVVLRPSYHVWADRTCLQDHLTYASVDQTGGPEFVQVVAHCQLAVPVGHLHFPAVAADLVLLRSDVDPLRRLPAGKMPSSALGLVVQAAAAAAEARLVDVLHHQDADVAGEDYSGTMLEVVCGLPSSI